MIKAILATIIGIAACIALLIIVGLTIESCSQRKVVKADTGEVVEEGPPPVKTYDAAGGNNIFDVVEIKRGSVTYLVFIGADRGGIEVVNYTMDSLEVAFHKEHLDKPDSSQNTIFDHVRTTQNH